MNTSALSKRRITAAHAFFLGTLLAFFALAPAIFPYGGRFVTRGDFIEQQLPFILETRRILRGGLNSYSFFTFLGAPAVGSYAFYTLGSVFVWCLPPARRADSIWHQRHGDSQARRLRDDLVLLSAQDDEE